jgi:hypothetical protein
MTVEFPGRVAELEGALSHVIAYLRALPVHPETHRQTLAAEKVLRQQVPMTTFEANKMYACGIVAIAVRVRGSRVEIKTSDVDRLGTERQERQANDIYKMLKIGVELDLQAEGDEPLYIFR